MSRNEKDTATPTRRHTRQSIYELLATVAMAACLLALVDGASPQLQMFLLSGRMLTNVFAKVLLVATLAYGLLLNPKIDRSNLPLSTWAMCLAYLILDIGPLMSISDVPISVLLQSYNRYYSYLLLAPAAIVFRGKVSERLIIRGLVWSLVICAVIGFAQHVTVSPLLYTEDNDNQFVVQAWKFFGDVRAFSLFSSGLSFGIFCSLCGALGITLSRDSLSRGVLLTTLAALACYTTLTRNAYLVFFCACSYSAIFTFGKKPTRGLWQPIVYFMLGVGAILVGLATYGNDTASDLQNNSSVFERVIEWTYYSDLLAKTSPGDLLLGLGIVQDATTDQAAAPAPIDNVPLVLVLHIGIVGLIIMSVFMYKTWLYVRREALTHMQPFLIAAVSLWATLACEGLFSTILAPFGIVLALVILCERRSELPQRHCQAERG